MPQPCLHGYAMILTFDILHLRRVISLKRNELFLDSVIRCYGNGNTIATKVDDIIMLP